MDASLSNTLLAAIKATPGGDPKVLRRSAEEFEAVFVQTLLQTMDSGLKSDGTFFGGPSEEVYRGLMSEAVSKEVAHAGGLGIADHIYRELLKYQEADGHVAR